MAGRTSRNKDAAAEAGDHSGKALVIVESPTKAKTINKYLGREYVVKACKGHVRDLPPRQYGIDPGRNFEPTYEVLASQRKVLTELKKAADHASRVYLATDLDREGEAIAWHLAHALELSPAKTKRVVFNEITKSAIAEAFAHPREIDLAKVDAQQARRILDRIVGYELSPLLWKKVAKGLSAGRVQSVAVRMIVAREQEIRAFQPRESWVIDGVFTAATERYAELTRQWQEFIRPKDGGVTPTIRERVAWMEQAGCFEAALVEIDGQPFKVEGRLQPGPDARSEEHIKVEKPKHRKTEAGSAGGAVDAGAPVYEFHSAVDAVRPIAEALGYRVRETAVNPWESYRHLDLKQVELLGETISAPPFKVKTIDTKRTSSKPAAPFTTASLQQAAAAQLRFTASKTMKTAQALYEGIDLKTGEGNVGLITYMRTDSVNLSAESVEAVRRFIEEHHGRHYLPDRPNRYGSAKSAQEAHEAIRPTDVRRTPADLRGHMTADEHKLYALIWTRFVACQMLPAEWDSTNVLLSTSVTLRPEAGQRLGPCRTGEAVFKANGRVLVFDGFYAVAGVPKNGEVPVLPPLTAGQDVAAVSIEPVQKFTSPPPRYNEASLVKALESEGIGRPSTYAAIIQTIQSRGYVEQEDRRFFPTARGEIVTEKLVAHFPEIMDLRFTSQMETELDQIEDEHLDWHDVLHEFYDPFKVALARAHQEMDAVRAAPSEYTCENCGKPMVYRFGKKGRFLSCTGYPECQNARDVDNAGKMIQPVIVTERCAVCGRQMVLRRSRRGPFLGCSGYPECNGTKPCAEDGQALKKISADEVKQSCPECGHPMQVKFSRGNSFLGCSAYPKCKGTAPMPEGVYVERPKPEEAGARCDKCGRPMVVRKSRRGPFLSCSGFPKCRNALPMEKLEHLKALEAAGEIPVAPPPGDKSSSRNGGVGANGNGAGRGKAKRLTKEEFAALGPPPPGFAWTLTGRPVVDRWPTEPLKCFSCGGEMTLRTGRFGPFFSCGKCRAAANLRGEAKKRAEAEAPAPERAKPIATDLRCPDCGAAMLLRMGKTGRFLGCADYPKCRKTMEAPPGLLREVAEAAVT